MKKTIVSIFILALSFIFVSAAYVAEEIITMPVTVTVPPVVAVSAAPLDFGNLSQTEYAYSETIITVNASDGTNYHIALDAGLHLDVARRVEYNSNFINYWLYTDSGRSIEWGDAGEGYANTYVNGVPAGPFTGNGSDQGYAVYGKISAAGSNPVGTYTDTVTVTVHY